MFIRFRITLQGGRGKGRATRRLFYWGKKENSLVQKVSLRQGAEHVDGMISLSTAKGALVV